MRKRNARVAERCGHRCVYCGVHENDAAAALTVDHHRPRAHEGRGADDNLVYCCPMCNALKGDYWHVADPPHIPLLHPLQDNLSAHIAEEDGGHLVGLTAQGSFFIRRLGLNRPPLVAYRIHRRTQQAQQEELVRLRRMVKELRGRVVELDTELRSVTDQIERETG